MAASETLEAGMSITLACKIAKSLSSSSGALVIVLEEAKKAADVVDRAELPGPEGCSLKLSVRAFRDSATNLEAIAVPFVQKWQDVKQFMEDLRSRSQTEMTSELAKEAVKPLQELVDMAQEMSKSTQALMDSLKKAEKCSKKLLKAAEVEKERKGGSNDITTTQSLSFFAGQKAIPITSLAITPALVIAKKPVTLVIEMISEFPMNAMVKYAAASGVVILAGLAFTGSLSKETIRKAASVLFEAENGDQKTAVLNRDKLGDLLSEIYANTEKMRDISETLNDAKDAAKRQGDEAYILQQGVTAALNCARTMDENEELKRKLKELMDIRDKSTEKK